MSIGFMIFLKNTFAGLLPEHCKIFPSLLARQEFS